MTASPFTFAALSAAAGTPLAADHPDRPSPRYASARRAADLAERVFLLKEALGGLLHIRQMEQAGVRLAGREDWERAWKLAAEAYGEEPAR